MIHLDRSLLKTWIFVQDVNWRDDKSNHKGTSTPPVSVDKSAAKETRLMFT
jgi:hypothetical protein